MKGVVTIGRFDPINPKTWLSLDTQWNTYVESIGLSGPGHDHSIREPRENFSRGTISHYDVNYWHHDCDGQSRAILFWSNLMPIQFRREHGAIIWSPEPYEVVLFNNHDPNLIHRRPLNIAVDAQRWSIVHRFLTPFDELRTLIHNKRKEMSCQKQTPPESHSITTAP